MAKGKKQRRSGEGRLRVIRGGAAATPSTSETATDGDSPSKRAVVQLVRERTDRPTTSIGRREAAPVRAISARRAEEAKVGRDDVAGDELDGARDSVVVPKSSLFGPVPTPVAFIAIVAVIVAVLFFALRRRDDVPAVNLPLLTPGSTNASASGAVLPAPPGQAMEPPSSGPTPSAAPR